MTSSDKPRAPGVAAQLWEQIAVTGIGLRREATALVLVLALLTFIAIFEAARAGAGLNADPELLMATLPLALFLPFGIWRGERVFDQAFLWLAPVTRQRAAVLRVGAGIFWLCMVVIIAFAWIAAVAFGTGGSLTGLEHQFLLDPAALGGGLVPIRRAPAAWQWLVPFFTALIVYLACSAAVVGLRNPLRIGGLLAFSLAMLTAVTLAVSPDGVAAGILGDMWRAFSTGPFGYDFALRAGAGSLVCENCFTQPVYTTVWYELPSVQRWLPAMLVWLTVVLALLALAIARHRERRE